MRRRLPMTRLGVFVLAANNLPPLTADTNRHRPSRAQPGNEHAASNAAPIAATA